VGSEKILVIVVSVINITRCVKVRLEKNIKMGLKEIGWRSINWANLAEDREKQIDLLKTVRIFWAV
jgi:hypothetical protein